MTDRLISDQLAADMIWVPCHDCHATYAEDLKRFVDINFVPKCAKHRDYHHGGAQL